MAIKESNKIPLTASRKACRQHHKLDWTDVLSVFCEPLQRTHLQGPLLKMSLTAGDEMSRGRNPVNGRRHDFGRGHKQSGFQYTYRPRHKAQSYLMKIISPTVKALVISLLSSLCPTLWRTVRQFVTLSRFLMWGLCILWIRKWNQWIVY